MRPAIAAWVVWLTVASSAQTPPPARLTQKQTDQSARRAIAGNLVGHGGPVKAIVSLGHIAVTGSFDYAAIVWDLEAGTSRVRHRLTGHNGAVNAVAFVGEDRVLTAGDDGVVRLWAIARGAAVDPLVQAFKGHDDGSKIVGLAVSHDGRLAVSSGWDRTARLWNLDEGSAGPILRDHTGPVNAAVFSGDGKTVFTASYDGAIRAFDAATGAMSRRVHNAGQSVNVLVRLRNGTRQPIDRAPTSQPRHEHDQLLFGTVSGESGILDARTGEILHRFAPSDRPILAAADGTIERSDHGPVDATEVVAIGGGDGRVRVFDYKTRALLQEHNSPFGPVWAIAAIPSPNAGPKALYLGGLDDFATFWPFSPRADFEPVDASQYRRRFEQTGRGDDPISRGELQFARKCSICHTLEPDGANRAGPTLHAVFGRRIATLPGYSYSEPLRRLDIVWNAETIAKLFELGPDQFTPGSKMPLQKMTDKAERDDLIAFLERATRPTSQPVDATAPNAHNNPQQFLGDKRP